MTQNTQLLNHFSVRPSITNVEANAVFKIRSLHRRILELEAQGHRFRREWKRDTTGQRYMRYHYLGKQEAA
jgi:hypothetical protein